MDNERRSQDDSPPSSGQDTIAAIATPIGPAGIGIIRISGPLAFQIAKTIFKPYKPPSQGFQHRRLYLGQLHDPSTGATLDEVLVSFMTSPHSYTREDVAEINSHSGYLLLSSILKIILDNGARLARPGEFTFRAFLNGRIDLTQAEAVVDLINSQSERGLHLASLQIGGLFKTEIEGLREKALDIIAQAEVAIDFPEEENEILSRPKVALRIQDQLVSPIKALIKAHSNRRIWVDGINTAIVGRVNAGKSSLLNRLLNEQRAIVTSLPGTTRDIIESTITIEGIPLNLMDTAGFGSIIDEVDRIGIRLAEKKMAEADLLLVVIDQSRPLNQDDKNIIERSRAKRAIIVLNKIDLPNGIGKLSIVDGFPLVKISALTCEGLDNLRTGIKRRVFEGDLNMTTSNVAPNLRHRLALKEAAGFFNNAVCNLKEEAPMEIIATDLGSGLDVLGEIIGETTNDEVLDRIFNRFCLGK